MIIVKTTGGEEFAAEDAKEVVRQMRDTNWNAPERKGDYMVEVQNRVGSMTGTLVRTDAEGFLADLARLGLIRIQRG